MAEQSTEERFAGLEREIAELRKQVLDLIAERRSYNELRAEVRSVARTVTQFSEREEAHENYVQARFGVVEHDIRAVNENVSELRTEVRAGMQDLRQGQQELASGQQQLIEFLMGKPKTSD